jgi:hypothetical protein
VSSNKRGTKEKREEERGNEKRTHKRYDLSGELWNKMRRLRPDLQDGKVSI